ncbi:MAG TPA: 5-deoxy-glucuronate isomerase [Chloroflexota bacterium]|nr:5-deoxy-glucuronate isomerase [Chloroflexota bacterium]
MIHPSAPPNDLTPQQLRVKPGPDGVSLAIDPARAGWRYLTFKAVSLEAGAPLAVGGAGFETALVVLAGGGLNLEPETGPTFNLEGRRTVFDARPWAAYLPHGHRGQLTAKPLDGDQVLVAIAEAPSDGRAGAATSPILIRPADVTVEVRGAGNATRRIHHIITPDFPADRLEVVEVYTPAGNWSSWPPHKHDVDDMPSEAVLEEIYYYQQRRQEGWAVQRLYRRDKDLRDGVWAVRHGELVLVTDGYHPFVAVHGYDAYYLNALAGDRRTMACTDDPDLAWTRAAWAEMTPDPRALAMVADQEA